MVSLARSQQTTLSHKLKFVQNTANATQAKAGLSGTWCIWQNSRGLLFHVPVFYTDLNLFYSIMCFPIYKSSVCRVGPCNSRMGPLPSTVNIFYHNEAPAKDNQISQHFLLGGHELSFSWDDHTRRIVMEPATLRDKMDTFHSYVEIFNPGVNWIESLFVSMSIFTAFHHFYQSDASSLSATRS